jgi:hypothetical protein
MAITESMSGHVLFRTTYSEVVWVVWTGNRDL